MENVKLDKYIGAKIVHAEPQNQEDRPGYKVVYEDGYVSWSPKEVFEKAYRRIDNLTFGLAIEALKQGKKVSRTGWNGKGIFLWLKPEVIVKESWCKDQVLLDIVKKHGFTTAFSDNPEDGNCSGIIALGTICMKTATDELLIGWLASQTDMLAEDWCIVGK